MIRVAGISGGNSALLSPTLCMHTCLHAYVSACIRVCMHTCLAPQRRRNAALARCSCCKDARGEREMLPVGRGHGAAADKHASPACQQAAAPPSPFLVVHFHGGGFIAQSSASHEVYLRDWAKALDAPIISIDYDLAPGASSLPPPCCSICLACSSPPLRCFLLAASSCITLSCLRLPCQPLRLSLAALLLQHRVSPSTRRCSALRALHARCALRCWRHDVTHRALAPSTAARLSLCTWRLFLGVFCVCGGHGALLCVEAMC